MPFINRIYHFYQNTQCALKMTLKRSILKLLYIYNSKTIVFSLGQQKFKIEPDMLRLNNNYVGNIGVVDKHDAKQ